MSEDDVETLRHQLGEALARESRQAQDSRRDMATLQSQLTKLQKELDVSKTRLQTALDDTARLTQDNRSLTSDLKSLDENYRRLEANCTRLEAEQSESKLRMRELAETRDELRAAKASLEDSKSSLAAANAANRTFRGQAQQYQSNLSDVSAENVQLQQQITLLKSQIANLEQSGRGSNLDDDSAGRFAVEGADDNGPSNGASGGANGGGGGRPPLALKPSVPTLRLASHSIMGGGPSSITPRYESVRFMEGATPRLEEERAPLVSGRGAQHRGSYCFNGNNNSLDAPPGSPAREANVSGSLGNGGGVGTEPLLQPVATAEPSQREMGSVTPGDHSGTAGTMMDGDGGAPRGIRESAIVTSCCYTCGAPVNSNKRYVAPAHMQQNQVATTKQQGGCPCVVQ